MSPNLSAAHFPPNQLLYEQVLYNSLKMAGLAYPQQNGTCTGYVIRTSFKNDNIIIIESSRVSNVNQMMADNKNIVVNGRKCSQAPCTESCAPMDCELCYSCLSVTQKRILFDAVAEHLNKGDTKRVVPADIVSKDKCDYYYLQCPLPN